MNHLIPRRSSLLAPFEEFIDEFFNRWDNFLTPNSLKNYIKTKALPKLNIYLKDDCLHIEAALPGLSKDQIKLSLEDNILTISAEAHQTKDVSDDDYLLREISKTAFSRSIQLPSDIDTSSIDNVQAQLENGILKLQFPLKNKTKSQTKQIKIN